ncbi:MAG: DUF86 domain-containing protein [Spirochaeta sp.]|nr:DUF86 domain-containing protein [Spirochaeta sp.]
MVSSFCESVARNDADVSSDIDILIDFEPEAESFDNLMNVADLLDMRFDFPNRHRSFRTELREKHADIPWRRIIALRNRIIRDYMGINFNIVVIATRIRFVRRIRCGS